ncbi:MAG: proline--tRNA ligase [Candidatus Diapherotrites archaeon]|nr:proline--tRNA ligase [Candidatus Diapherotrites archaeon]
MAQENQKEEKITFNIDKDRNFSEWFTEIIKVAELADMRYNVKGFVVFQPWSVLAMEAMYDLYERALQRKGHNPMWFPAVIPEKNFFLERSHVEGFAPEVFWITEHGASEKLEEKLALRPTSETAIYQMYSLWIRSYKDLPFKAYQRAQVWRHETKATRPFLRSREFYWIEAHDVFANEEGAMRQVHEDMEIAEEILHKKFGVPFIFFKRPQWDKFAGAVNTYAADAIMPNGKIVQQPSTHLLEQNFSKAFDVKFRDSDGNEKYAYITCYGPCISRMFASVIAMHGDSKGLKFPFEIAPKQIVIVPIAADKNNAVMKKAQELADLLSANYRVEIDASEKSPGEKFYYWEMKGVPLRIELGPKEVKEKKLTIYRRDTNKKEAVSEKQLLKFVESSAGEITENLCASADKYFSGIIKDAKSLDEIKSAVDSGKIARTNFCSTELGGAKCAETIEKQLGARVRGTRVDKSEKPSGKCAVCGKEAKEVVYIANEY